METEKEEVQSVEENISVSQRGGEEVEVCEILDEHVWGRLHEGHMGLRGTLHRRSQWRLNASKKQLK